MTAKKTDELQKLMERKKRIEAQIAEARKAEEAARAKRAMAFVQELAKAEEGKASLADILSKAREIAGVKTDLKGEAKANPEPRSRVAGVAA